MFMLQPTYMRISKLLRAQGNLYLEFGGIMAKAGPTACNIAKKKKKKKKITINFSESEIDVALQLVQLGGDSSDHRNGVVELEGTAERSTNHAVSIKDNFFQQQEDEAIISLIIRKNTRFRSISDIYKLTKPLSIVKY